MSHAECRMPNDDVVHTVGIRHSAVSIGTLSGDCGEKDFDQPWHLTPAPRR
jgi:hypothetical protein